MQRANASSRLMLSAYPCRLPHVAVEGEEVFFGSLKDGRVSAAEREFLKLCDGRTRFGEILEAGPELMLAAGTTGYVVWLPSPVGPSAEPAPSAELAGGEHCLLIGAHPGDVELSMGGFVLRHREETRFTQLICFGNQLETREPEAFGSRREVTAIRRDESNLTARVLAIGNIYFDFPEYVLRRTEKESERMTMAHPHLVAAFKIALYDTLVKYAPAHVYAPAAVGNHPDQRLIFDQILEFFEEDYFPETSFHFYENFPLSASYLHIDDFLSRFEDSYFGLEPWFDDVSDQMEEKLVLLEVFRSRFDRSCRPLLLAVGGRNARLARQAPGSERDAAGWAERFWTLTEVELYG